MFFCNIEGSFLMIFVIHYFSSTYEMKLPQIYRCLQKFRLPRWWLGWSPDFVPWHALLNCVLRLYAESFWELSCLGKHVQVIWCIISSTFCYNFYCAIVLDTYPIKWELWCNPLCKDKIVFSWETYIKLQYLGEYCNGLSVCRPENSLSELW